MSQKHKFQILLVVALIGLTALSCKKENVNVDITSNKWEVVKIKRQGESSYSKAKKSYILEFKSDTTYSFIFDVNDCFGYYEIISNGNIKINAMGCTQICCDSDFAVELMQMFPKMSKYYGRGNELIFEGEGKIILKPN